MTLIFDLFCLLLAVGAALHAWGSLQAFADGTPARVWAVGSALVPALLAAVAFALPPGGAGPGMTATLVAGLLAWAVTALAFGRSIGRMTDPRVLWHVLAALGLAVLLTLGG